MAGIQVYISILCIFLMKDYGSNANLQKPVIAVSSTDTLEGESVSVKCSYNGAAVNYIVWFYHKDKRDASHSLFLVNKVYPTNDQNGKNAWNNRVTENKEDFAGYSITLSNATVFDDNPIVCQIADNGFGRNVIESDPVPLIVSVRPSVGKILNKTNLVVKANELTNLNCVSDKVKPAASVNFTWYFNGEKLVNSDNITTVLNNDQKTYKVRSSLWKKFNQSNDAMKVKCEMKWTFKSHQSEIISSDDGALIVQYPPTWNGGSRTIHAELDGEVQINCSVKSNPPIKEIKWYKQGSNLIIHNGAFLHFTSLSSNDYSIYTCEVNNGVDGTKQFDITLKEDGPPQLKNFQILGNRTSTRMTVSWNKAQHGGHPPVVYYLTISKQSDMSSSKIQITSAENPQPVIYYTTDGLLPNTKYNFQLVAESKRNSVTNKSNRSIPLEASSITRKSPSINITTVTITDKLTIKWKYRTTLDQRNYMLTLKVRYGTRHSDTIMVHPAVGSIDVTSGYVDIPVYCNSSSMSYTVSLLVYENGFLSVPAIGSKITEHVECLASAGSSNTLIIIIAVVSAVALVLVVGIIVAIVIVFAGKRKQKESRSIRRPPYIGTLQRDFSEEKNVENESMNGDVNDNIYECIPGDDYDDGQNQNEDDYVTPVSSFKQDPESIKLPTKAPMFASKSTKRFIKQT